MFRYSAKVKEISDLIWYQTDLKKAKEQISELRNPLDIAYIKLWIGFLTMHYQRIDEFLDIMNDVEIINKTLNRFLFIIINATHMNLDFCCLI